MNSKIDSQFKDFKKATLYQEWPLIFYSLT